jgi:RNase H
MELHSLSDRMPRKFDFEADFRVEIPERDAWDNIPAEREALVFYTDGSRKEGQVGMGICGPSLRHYEALGTTPTIFQAEMNAINVCPRICLNLEGISGKHIYIMSESQAALRATFSSKLVAECLEILKRRTRRCLVTLMWVPGRTGIEGNEIASQLANKGAETYFIGPEPFFGFNGSKYKRELAGWMNKRKRVIPWEFDNGRNHGSEICKISIFPDSRPDSKKKKFYSKALKFKFFFLEQLLIFGCFLAPKRGPFTNVTVKLPKTREIYHSKTFFYVKISVLSVFEHKNFLRVCLHRLF